MRAKFPTLPQGCVAITPQWTDTFQVKTMEEPPKPPYNVRRYGFRLCDAYAVTDFYCQGMNFKRDRWMAHLNIPTDGQGLVRAALFVVLTRWGECKYVWLVAPLWPENDAVARDKVIDAFHAIACLEPHLKKELERLRQTAAQAKQVYVDQWLRAVQAVLGSNSE